MPNQDSTILTKPSLESPTRNKERGPTSLTKTGSETPANSNEIVVDSGCTPVNNGGTPVVNKDIHEESYGIQEDANGEVSINNENVS